MGKGDKKTKKGKLFRGSFGNSRKRKITKADAKPAATVAASGKKTA